MFVQAPFHAMKKVDRLLRALPQIMCNVAPQWTITAFPHVPIETCD